MDHQHAMPQVKEHANHSSHTMDAPMGMAGHDHHKMMIEDFKKRFWISLIINSNPQDILDLILFGKATYKKMIQNLVAQPRS